MTAAGADDARANWDEVRARLEAMPPGSRISLLRDGMPHPEASGARRDLGLPAGQLADWRFPPGEDCTGLHVHEHAERWEAHLDRVHPACSLVGHVQHDAPQLLVAGGAALGAFAGRSSLLGMAVGAVLGGVVGAALARHIPPSQPRTTTIPSWPSADCSDSPARP